MIECRDVSQVFGDRAVLHRVTFEVPSGEIYGFIGPNGAGKTTTIKVLATLLAPTSGTAKIDGIDVVEDPVEARKVLGYMPDNAGVYRRVTAREYLDFFASACGLPVAQRPRRIANVVELTEIGQLLDREVMALSKGQRQRLLLAKTLLHDPKVLILDEPASDLDPRARIELRVLLAELGRMKKTVLLSSHILTELSDLCSWVGIIEGGRVLASGPIDTVQSQLRPGRRMKLRALGKGEVLETVLKGFTFVTAVRALSEPSGDETLTWEVDFDGDDWRLAEVITAVTAAGVPLVGVAPEGRNLERIFMDLTAAPATVSSPGETPS